MESNKDGSDMAVTQEGRSIELVLPSEVGYERVAMEGAGAFARMLGFPSERIEDLKTAVAEACLNALQHGNRNRPGAKVRVTLTFKEKAISVRVMDEGEGIVEIPDLPETEEAMIRLQPPRGLGMFLIRRLTDAVDFNEPTEKGHVVKMVIRREGCTSLN